MGVLMCVGLLLGAGCSTGGVDPGVGSGSGLGVGEQRACVAWAELFASKPEATGAVVFGARGIAEAAPGLTGELMRAAVVDVAPDREARFAAVEDRCAVVAA